jgi:general secretion pathway protein D
MSRTYPSLPVLALIASLTACAQPGLASPDDVATAVPAEPASAPEVAPVLPPAQPASAASGAQDEATPEPIVIRGTDHVVAPRHAPANAPAAGSTRLQFDNAPVGEVVNVMLRDLLKVDYVIHPPLNGTVTLTTRQSISADRALLLLETALQANGIVMARDSRGTYHVGAPDTLRGIVSVPVLASPGQRLPPGYGTVIIPLQYLGAAEMANILRPMVAPDAILRVDTVRNILVMRGTRAEAEGWLELVDTFDVNLLRGMSVGVFPLKHASTADVETALRLLSGGTLSGAAGAAAPGGPPIRPQTPAQQQMQAQVLQQRRLAAAQANAPGGAQPGLEGLGESSPLFGAVRVLPIERINAIMVVTPRAAYLDEIRYWIEQFDRPNLNNGEPQLFVYKVQNSSADHLAELINGIYGGTVNSPAGPGATGVAPGLSTTRGTSGAFGNNTGFGGNGLGSGSFGSGSFGGSNFGNNSFGSSFGGSGGLGGNSLNSRLGSNTLAQQQQNGGNVSTVTLGDSVRVMADRINNTLLIYAMPGEYERIEATLKRLDVPRAQVLLEASIIEVTLSDGLQYGLQWAFNNGGLGGGRSGKGVLSNNQDGSVGFGTTTTGQGFTYTISNSSGTVKAMLSALASKSLIRVISSPSLMVLDNHTAAIQVGDQIPVNTGTTISDVSNYQSTNIQYKDTGVMLDVTPSISAGDLITLDINQMVSDQGADSTSSATKGYPTFTQRQISSMVSVRSGETMVLGGLIKDKAENDKSGLPFLSSIPVIGALFGTHTNDSARTELLIVLTPRVVRSDEDARAVSRELRERMRGLTLSPDADTLPAASRP